MKTRGIAQLGTLAVGLGILGTSSTALAGSDAGSGTAGDFDLAAAFGDMLTASAQGSNFLVGIVPSL